MHSITAAARLKSFLLDACSRVEMKSDEAPPPTGRHPLPLTMGDRQTRGWRVAWGCENVHGELCSGIVSMRKPTVFPCSSGESICSGLLVG